MNTGLLASIFAAAIIRVFARAFQQLSVVGYRWKLVAPVSFLMCAADYFQWGSAAYLTVQHDWVGVSIAVCLAGIGGATGTYAAMWLHKRLA